MILTVVILSIGEIKTYIFPPIKEQLVATTDLRSTLNETTILFNFIMNFPCLLVHLDVFDLTSSKEPENQVSLTKTRIDLSGNVINSNFTAPTCGDCYGATSQSRKCCNSCQEIMDAYQVRSWSIKQMPSWNQCINEHISFTGEEKCILNGSIVTSTWLRGGFHIAPGINTKSPFGHMHDYSPLEDNLNLSHEIKYLTFGNPIKSSPLDDTWLIQDHSNPVHYRYNLNAVPTVYTNGYGTTKRGFQYTVNFAEINVEKFGRYGPGLFFIYNFAPVAVVASPETISILVLISRIISIIGGTFMLGRLIDTFGYRLHTIEGKMRIGKAE